MNDFVIIPDTSCDLTKDLRKRFNIEHVVRGVVYPPDGSQIYADLDWEVMSPEEYYASMRGRNILYKTATPPVGEITEVFETALKEGKDILAVTLSTGISGTFNVVKGVADQLMEQYPERKIVCIDSLRYASAEGLLTILGCLKREEGATLDETAEYLNTIKHSIHQSGCLDDLFFCVKTGRVTSVKAFFGTLVGVNTLADFSSDGVPKVIGKTKGKRAAIDAIIRYMKETIVNPEKQIIFVAHSVREESAKILAEKIRETFNPKEIIINPVGISCGSSIGPGMCAAFYIGDPISEDGSKEETIMDKVLKSK
ncbi:MAG: DegV family protein [Clostridia bacterium]|nr:DegV family protein [Clostridia bacterium]